jgi:hypothetical protein
LRPILVSKYSILQFHGIENGARAYLAVQRLRLTPLNSYSTHLKAVAVDLWEECCKDDEIGFREIDLTVIGKKRI